MWWTNEAFKSCLVNERDVKEVIGGCKRLLKMVIVILVV